MATIDDEQLEIIKTVCTERGPVDQTLTEAGNLQFDEYLKLYGMTIALEIRLLKHLDDKFKPVRLEALKSNDHKLFGETVANMLNLQT